MAKNFWRIRGHSGFDEFLDLTVPAGSMTEDQVQDLLRCFAAKEALSYREILGAYVKRRTKLTNDLLHVQKNGPYPEYRCGLDLCFTAIVVDENGDRIKYRRLGTSWS